MKKSLLLILVLSMYCILEANAQNAPGIEWEKSFGGSGYDEANAVQQTSDGGFILAGQSTSNDDDVTGNQGSYDFWVVKLDPSGILEWQTSLGGTSSDFASAVQQTNDNGYVLVGYSKSNNGDVTGHHGTTTTLDYWVVKLDSAGTLQWQKSLGGTFDEFGTSVQQTADSGFVIAGYSFSNDGDVTGHHNGSSVSDYWIVKLSPVGNLVWQKSLGGNSYDYANSIQQTSDGGFIVGGATSSTDLDVSGNHGSFDFWIVKLDSAGNITWQKCLGGSDDDRAFSIQQTTDGGFITAGHSKSNSGDATGNHGIWDYWVVKLDSTGNLEWQKSLGGSAADVASSVEQTSDGGYIVTGYTASYGGDVSGNHGVVFWGDYWVVKLNNSGTLVWQKCLGGTDDDVATWIRETISGGFIISGWTQSVNGDISLNHGSTDIWIVQLSTPTTVEEGNNSTFSSSVFPNPASNLINLQLKLENSGLPYTGVDFDNAAITITNVFGQRVLEKTSPFVNGTLHAEIFLDKDFIPGMYLVNVSCAQQHWEKPLMVIK